MSEVNTTKIRFWGGLRSIGGTIVTIEYNDSRVIFDFGLLYDPSTNIYDGQIKRRKASLVRDHLKLGTIPKIEGIYSKKELGDQPEVVPEEESALNTAVIISHLHLDHIGAMGLLSPAIPIYFSEDSKKLYESLYTIGEGVMGDEGRTYHACSFGVPFFVGDIKITPIPIDHDIPGACGFHIETPDGAIVYTGDLRFHGKNPEITKAFIEDVKAKGLDALITEGTTLRAPEELSDEEIVPSPDLPKEMVTERNIPQKLIALFKKTPGLAIFNPYNRNIERLQAMIDAAHESGRKPVFEPETAYLAVVFLSEKDFYAYASFDTLKELENGTAPEWKKDVFKKIGTITADVINETPGQYVLQNTYENSLELFDFNVENGIYIHSNGVPLGPFDPAYENLDRILAVLKLEKFTLMAGGHAIPNNLKYFVDELDPAILIPLHSFFPERLKPKSGRQLLPLYNVNYELKNHTIEVLNQ